MSSPENPFGAPKRVHQPATEFRSGPTVPYASADNRARFAVVMLAGCGLTLLILIVSTWWQVQFLEEIRGGMRPMFGQALAHDNRQLIVAGIYLLAFLASIITFCLWKHRVHRNLRSLGAKQLSCSPAWAVGSYFVPILNFFRPFQIMKEIDHHSMPDAENATKSGETLAIAAPVGAWWATWILFCISSKFSGYMAGNDLDSMIFGSYLLIVSKIFGIVACIVCSIVVLRISDNQCRKHMQNAGAGVKPPGPDEFAIPVARRVD